jgi:PAS domain S-box-containing protein
MRLSAILPVIALLNILTALYVYRKAPLPTPARCFALLALTIAGWTIALAQAHYGFHQTTFFTRLTFAFASLMPVAILCVFRTFPHESRLLLDLPSKLLICLGAVSSLLSFTSFVVAHATRTDRTLLVVYGPLHAFYAATTASCLLWSSHSLLSRYRRSTGVARLQFRYLLIGIILPGIGVLTTNLIIPLAFSTSAYGQYGPYFALIFLLFTAHALIRYRLMDIRVAIRTGVAVLFSAITCTLTTLALYLILLRIQPRSLTLPHWGLLLLLSAILALLLPSLSLGLKRVVNSYTFRARVDYASILETASVRLSQTLDLHSLAQYLVPTILNALHLENVSFYLQSQSDYRLVLQRSHTTIAHPSPLPLLRANSPVICALLASNTPLVADDPYDHSFTTNPSLSAFFRATGYAVVLPVRSDDTLVAALCLGPKLSTDPFFNSDLTFLSALTSHAATALVNSTLYHKLLINNQYLTNILASMDSAILATSAAGDITLANQAATRLLGISVPPTQAAANVTLLPEPLRSALLDTLNDGKSRLSREASLIDVRHTRLPVAYSTSPLGDSQGQILGALLVINDLTVLKTLETHAQHTERLASLASVAAALAHEIKNPLVAIRTSAELLDERYSDADFRSYFANVVISEITRIDELVSKLHMLALPTPTDMVTVDIRDPLNMTLALLRGHLDLKRLTISFACTLSSPAVYGNDSQLRQLFLNILLNAINASPHGSALDILITAVENAGRPSVRILISDSGLGIPPSLLSTVFDPFVSGLPGGSGLGLAIARSIVHVHRGSITITNNAQRPGATLIIDLPADSGHPATFTRVFGSTAQLNA